MYAWSFMQSYFKHQLEQLEDEEASLKGREEGLNYLLSLQPEIGVTYRDELKQVRH